MLVKIRQVKGMEELVYLENFELNHFRIHLLELIEDMEGVYLKMLEEVWGARKAEVLLIKDKNIISDLKYKYDRVAFPSLIGKIAWEEKRLMEVREKINGRIIRGLSREQIDEKINENQTLYCSLNKEKNTIIKEFPNTVKNFIKERREISYYNLSIYEFSRLITEYQDRIKGIEKQLEKLEIELRCYYKEKGNIRSEEYINLYKEQLVKRYGENFEEIKIKYPDLIVKCERENSMAEAYELVNILSKQLIAWGIEMEMIGTGCFEFDFFPMLPTYCDNKRTAVKFYETIKKAAKRKSFMIGDFWD